MFLMTPLVLFVLTYGVRTWPLPNEPGGHVTITRGLGRVAFWYGPWFTPTTKVWATYAWTPFRSEPSIKRHSHSSSSRTVLST